MFDDKSRYKNLETYQVEDSRGRQVSVVPVPNPPIQILQGFHLMKQGHRIDHLAAQYINDPTGFWRICEVNDVMLPEALSEQQEVAIPFKNR